MSERTAEPQVVCPFVAFDDDRDFRSTVPDHRHRCFAESPAATRALAHQAAYCLAPVFPSCPTFVDWARREAAPAKVESPIRSVRGPAGAARASTTPPPGSGSAVDVVARPAGPNWAAPPPWGGAAGAAALDAAAGGREAARLAGGGAAEAGLPAFRSRLEHEALDGPGEAAAAPEIPSEELDDAPAFLAGRGANPAAPAPAAWDENEPWDDGPDEPLSNEYEEPLSRRPVTEPRRVPVGYAPVAPTRNDRRGGPRGDRRDPVAPSWEQPRHFEAYPTLRSRGGLAIPRPAIYALIILLVGIGLFATPLLLKGLGGGGEQASPAPSPSGSLVATAPPSATPKPTPAQVVYTVKANDTLSKIAAKYGVTIDQILAANPKITNPNRIAVGDEVIIPQPLPSEVVDSEITPVP